MFPSRPHSRAQKPFGCPDARNWVSTQCRKPPPMRASGSVPAPEPGVRLPQTARGLAGGWRGGQSDGGTRAAANMLTQTPSVGSARLTFARARWRSLSPGVRMRHKTSEFAFLGISGQLIISVRCQLTYRLSPRFLPASEILRAILVIPILLISGIPLSLFQSRWFILMVYVATC